jgi:LysM repeat protein
MQVVITLLLCAGVLMPHTVLAAPAQSMGMGNTEWAEVYTVRRGDTLGDIALMFNVSQAALMKANMLRNPNTIYVGQQLIIPEREGMGGGMGGPECVSYYTVRRGDTLSEIALTNGLDAYALARANGVSDLNEIYVGQRLCIPAGGKGMSKSMEMPMDGPQRPMGESMAMPMDGPQRPMGESMEMPMDGPQRPMGESMAMPMDGPQRPMGESMAMPMDGPQRPMGESMAMPMDGPQRPMGESMGMPMDDWNRPSKPEMRPTEYWKGSYFTDKYFSEFAMERQDLEVNFNWGTGSPFGNSNEDRFSVRWEKVEFFKGGAYTFFATADDGVRVYVDDQLIIDGWVIQPATDYKADIHLGEGPHKLVVEYYEEAEDAKIRVWWEAKRQRH